MATTGKINGTSLLLYVTVDGGAATAVSYTSSCSISITGPGTIDVSNKDSSNWLEKLKRKGYSWTASADGMATFDGTVSTDELFQIFRNNKTVTVKISTSDADDRFFSGDCTATSYSFDAPGEDATTYSIEFEGLDELAFTAT